MSEKLAGKCWKSGIAAVGFALICSISGCGDTPREEICVEEPVTETSAPPDNVTEREEKLVKICQDLYERAEQENKMADLETIRGIVSRFGENGYPAVDSRNQVDMVRAEQLMQFCETVDAKGTAEITVIQVDSLGGFITYDLHTSNGTVDVVRSYYKYQDKQIRRVVTGTYQAEYWNTTEDGYLMFSGVWFSEEAYVLTLSGAEEHTALRMQPLDGTCRELNRKYLLPVGYNRNNMFLTDWREEDFGELDFYDLFDIFYPVINGRQVPYTADADLGVGAVYRIPKEVFENVIMTHFDMDSETLQSKTVYHPEDSTYEYKPRGFYETEYPEHPYPEVVGYTENNDGTITLTVHVVFPYEDDSCVFAHEVVVRPLENGGVQYVSNRILPSADNRKETWYTPRLTEEEWENIYGGEGSTGTKNSAESSYWMITQADHCLFTEEEKKDLQETVLSAAKSVSDIYKNVTAADVAGSSFGVVILTDEQRKTVVDELGGNGLVSVAENVNMQNHEALEKFYADYLKKQDAMVTVFEVQQDGLIGAETFLCRDGGLQTYNVGVSWKQGGIPQIQGTSVNDVSEIRLTEKGYFIYAYNDDMTHSSLRQCWRAEPLSEECRELTEKYILGLSYVNYNMLVTDWDSSNVEDILMPCMFEDIYRIYTGKNIKAENGKIPAEEYEKIMTTCFPVSVTQLREHCGYDETDNSYEYEMIFAHQYPPFGEVVDYKNNADGTITLVVDGVWPDYDSDFAFRNTIVVQPFPDGTFRYLSNSVEQEELELPPVTDAGVVSDEETIRSIQKKAAKTGFSVTASIPYSNMENPERFEAFLKNCINGESDSGVVYKVQQDGNIERMKFTFDGVDMYVTSIRGVWGNDGVSDLGQGCTAGIREWNYTEKGWFCYEMCVPEPPAVSEVINGYCRIRVKPMTEEQRELSRKCVWTPGYQGNNLLCSNWDINHMEMLDYNGLYEYLYEMKYGKKFLPEKDTCGIPAEDFESLIMEYLPVTTEQLREYAVYDEENQTYAWERLGCLNYAPTAFGTSVPEVTDIRENADGTVTLTVDALCDMVACDDAVITHELTIRFAEDGTFRYLGNHILDNGIMRIPDYQYRIME